MPYQRDKRGGGNSNKKYAGKNFGSRGLPTMHQTTCSECQKECEVPFKPNGQKPVFCRDCFKKNSGEMNGPMHKTTCSACGDHCEVPFRPSGEKPIYCSKCFGKDHDAKPGNIKKSTVEKSSGSSITKAQFEILNSKLDKILDALDSAL